MFESLDKSVFDRDESQLKVKPLTELLDRSRKFAFLETWRRNVKDKRHGYAMYLFQRILIGKKGKNGKYLDLLIGGVLKEGGAGGDTPSVISTLTQLKLLPTSFTNYRRL